MMNVTQNRSFSQPPGNQQPQQNRNNNAPVFRPIPPDYLNDLQNGYFGDKAVIRKEFLIKYPDGISKSFSGMTYTQIRSFFSSLRNCESAYRYAVEGTQGDSSIAEAKLLAKIQALNGIVTYAASKQSSNVPENFRKFMISNIEVCKNARDVLEGFIPHYESVLGYFRYNFPYAR